MLASLPIPGNYALVKVCYLVGKQVICTLVEVIPVT